MRFINWLASQLGYRRAPKPTNKYQIIWVEKTLTLREKAENNAPALVPAEQIHQMIHYAHKVRWFVGHRIEFVRDGQPSLIINTDLRKVISVEIIYDDREDKQ